MLLLCTVSSNVSSFLPVPLFLAQNSLWHQWLGSRRINFNFVLWKFTKLNGILEHNFAKYLLERNVFRAEIVE
jgi:hypothetical protein